MSDLWKYLSNLSSEELDRITCMTSAEIMKKFMAENYHTAVKKLFHVMIENKCSPEVAIYRDHKIDQEWVIDMIQHYITKEKQSKFNWGE